MAHSPEPDAPDSRSTWRRQADNILETQIARYPFLVQLRAVWRQLQDERESWPILLPVVAVVFVLVYRHQRKLTEALIREVAE